MVAINAALGGRPSSKTQRTSLTINPAESATKKDLDSPIMTKEIIETIVRSIERGPNVDYLVNFWRKMKEESKIR